MGESNNRASLAGNIVMSLISISLCLVVVEFFLRFQYHSRHEQVDTKSTCYEASPHAALIYTRKANTCDTNARGFEDREYTLRKDSEDFRVVVIGDSVAAGLGVKLDDKFSNRLEDKLNANDVASPGKAEVIILAQPGYSTSQEIFLLENEALDYAPDLILWSYVLNDPAHPVYHDANGELGTFFYEPGVHLLHFIKSKLFTIAEKIKASGCEKEFHALIHCVYWVEVERNIQSIARISKEGGVPVLFVIHPVFEEGRAFSDYSLEAIHEKIAATATGAGLPVLDLLDTYRPYEAVELELSNGTSHDIWHPNKKGHELAAEAIMAYLQQNPQLWRATNNTPR